MSSGPDTPTFPPNPTPFGFGFTNVDKKKMELSKCSNVVETVEDEIDDEIEDFTSIEEVHRALVTECSEIQANCIDSTIPTEAVFTSEVQKLIQEQFKSKEQVTLEPYERDHACVNGFYRMPKKTKDATA